VLAAQAGSPPEQSSAVAGFIPRNGNLINQSHSKSAISPRNTEPSAVGGNTISPLVEFQWGNESFTGNSNSNKTHAFHAFTDFICNKDINI
jgi:hypothetical protein